MKITEITSRAGKQIKKLQRLYSSYIFNPLAYSTLYKALIAAMNTNDVDVKREAEILTEKLHIEILEALKK
jgi:hypothetical protein